MIYMKKVYKESIWRKYMEKVNGESKKAKLKTVSTIKNIIVYNFLKVKLKRIKFLQRGLVYNKYDDVKFNLN